MEPKPTQNDRPRQGFFAESACLPRGWQKSVRMEISDGRIVSLETDAVPQAGDDRVAILLPGMANLHSHAFQRGMAGLAEQRGPGDDSFWTWREVMYRFVARILPEDLEAIAALAYLEMLESGFTRVAEFHYLHHRADGTEFADIGEMAGRIAAAADASGIGLTLLPVFYAHGGFGGQALGALQAPFGNDVARYERLIEASRAALRPLTDPVLGIAPHSLRAVTETELREILPLAQSGPVHIHIAEQRREVEDCLSWSGARPVQWLYDHAPVDRSWCLVHATHLTEAETRSLSGSGAVAGLCPVTEANLGDGLFPLVPFQEQKGIWGVGSDSNVQIGLSDELRLLEYGQRLTLRGRNIAALAAGAATGGDLFRAALAGGAQACGVAAGLAVGAPADFFSLDSDHPGLVGRGEDRLLDSFVFGQAHGMIDGVWRAGRQCVSQGRHHRREAIIGRYRGVLRRLAV